MSEEVPQPEARNEDTEKVVTLTISGTSNIIGTLQAFARKEYGPKGVSKAACEAFTEYLDRRGVAIDGADKQKADQRLKLLNKIEEAGADVDNVLKAVHAAVERKINPVHALGAAYETHLQAMA